MSAEWIHLGTELVRLDLTNMLFKAFCGLLLHHRVYMRNLKDPRKSPLKTHLTTNIHTNDKERNTVKSKFSFTKVGKDTRQIVNRPRWLFISFYLTKRDPSLQN